jgi:hypothetical protein
MAHAINMIGECAKLNIKALNSLLLISNLNSSSANYDLNRSISNSSQANEENLSESNNSVNNYTRTKIYGIANSDGGIENWPWELACIYADVLAEICINGSQSSIKKKALLGFCKDSGEALKINRKNLKGYGLIDLARFQLRPKKNREGCKFF